MYNTKCIIVEVAPARAVKSQLILLALTFH